MHAAQTRICFFAPFTKTRAPSADFGSIAAARIIRVTDHITKMRPFAAQFTLHRHNIPVQSPKNVKTVATILATHGAFPTCH